MERVGLDTPDHCEDFLDVMRLPGSYQHTVVGLDIALETTNTKVSPHVARVARLKGFVRFVFCPPGIYFKPRVCLVLRGRCSRAMEMSFVQLSTYLSILTVKEPWSPDEEAKSLRTLDDLL